MNEISISMGEHKTTENIAKTGAFTVSMATADTVTASDYVGIESAAEGTGQVCEIRFPRDQKRICKRASDR